jgi:hypothetical protein
MLELQTKFMHRPKQNDEFASICTRCFTTVGSGRNETELDAIEKNHVCDRNVLDRLGISAGRGA